MCLQICINQTFENKIPLYIPDKYIQVKNIPAQYWLLHRRLKESCESNKPFQSILEYKRLFILMAQSLFDQ
jgi:hypothetical protein